MTTHQGYAKYIRFLVYLILVILINVVGTTLFFRVDLTENRIYSISDASKQVVATLTEPLTIKVFFTKNLPAPHNNTERYLHDLLEEYALHANRYFNYRFYDVSPEAEGVRKASESSRELANSYGIHPVQIQAVEKDEIKFKKAYMGLVLIHGDMIERIPTITTTSGLEYNLTTAIQKLNNKISALLGLQENIRITLYLSDSLMRVAPMMGLDDLVQHPEQINRIVKRLNEKNYGKLDYRHADPAQNPEAQKALKQYNLMTLKWPAAPKHNLPAGEGSIGMVMEHQDKVRTIPLLKVIRIPIIGAQYNLTRTDELEEMIDKNIETLIEINQDLGYLASHGTLGISGASPLGQQDPDALTNFNALISNNYTLKPVDLKQGEIPESLACLVIARPMEKFSDYELYQIDQALMRGTRLALFLDAFKEVHPQQQQAFQFNQGPVYLPLDTGLEKLLNHYGIRIKKSIVMDEHCHKQRFPQHMGGGERDIYFAPIIKNQNITKELEFMKNIRGLIAVKASPLELDEKRISENRLTAVKLFASSEKSWEMKKQINLNPLFISPPASFEEKGSLPLAYLIEGRFPSYFKGKPMPEKAQEQEAAAAKTDAEKKTPDPETEPPGEPRADESKEAEKVLDLSRIERTGGFIPEGKPGKIFVLASSEMLKNNILSADGASPNEMMILNIIDALNGREAIAVMRSKEQRFNPLNETSASTKMLIKTFNIAGLPLLTILFGAAVWLRRVSRKKRIQLMFQK